MKGRDAAREAIEHLVGTCNSIETSDWERWTGDAEFCAVLDEEIFLCEVCGWWCEQSENNGDQVCEDCVG